jgi:translation initiation factor IF-3
MRPRGGRRPDTERREPQTRINEAIRVREVQLIGESGENKGVVPIAEAQRYAEEQRLDLVEISPQARPPVCRVMDYSKWKYEQNIKEKEARRNRSQIIIKEIKFRPKIGKADYETKKNHVRRFLEADDKVKVTIMFRGREVVHNDLGRKILERVAEDCKDLAVVETRPNLEGRNMTMMLGPLRKPDPPKAKPSTDGTAGAAAPTESKAAPADAAAAKPEQAPDAAPATAKVAEAAPVEAPAETEAPAEAPVEVEAEAEKATKS